MRTQLMTMCLAVSLCACGPEEMNAGPEKQTAAITPLRTLFVGTTISGSGLSAGTFIAKLNSFGPVTYLASGALIPSATTLKQNYDLVVIARLTFDQPGASASLVGFVLGGGRVLMIGGFDNTAQARTREQYMLSNFGIAVDNTGLAGQVGPTSFAPTALTKGSMTTPPGVIATDLFSDAVGPGVAIEANVTISPGFSYPIAVTYQSQFPGGGRAFFWLDDIVITDDPTTGTWTPTQVQYWDNVFNYLNP